jgi:uncharacterized protein
MICLSLSDERVHLNVAQNKTVLFSMNVIARLLGEPSIAQRMNEMSADQILLTGSSGLIGTSLIRSLRHKRISTITLRRDSSPSDDATEFWDPYAAVPVNLRALEGTTAAVHLSGANIAGQRWTSAFKRNLRDSRITPTHALSRVLAALQPKPAVLVSASAVGIYGNHGDEVLTEASSPGNGFLAELCLEWEKATQPALDAGIRVVHLRFGVVLSPEGGALARMLPTFRAGLGGKLGSGRQWFSWAALPDAIRIIEFALRTESLSGPVNLVAPNPVTNAEFTRVLGHILHRPTLLRVPAFGLRLALGEMAQAILLESQRVVPASLSAAGFNFEYPEIGAALEAALAPSKQ